MKQSLKKEKLSGEAGFDAYYGDLFGSRWPALRASLAGEVRYIELTPGGAKSYFLDPASVCSALCLSTSHAFSFPESEGDFCVADLCAAPGGKSLVIASCMEDKSLLYSNERSPARKKRLDVVVQESLSDEIFNRVKTSCSDASLWGRREKKALPGIPDEFDAIFLDAPCSSERHVLSDKKYLDIWSPARIKGLAVEQWALLSSAWRILKKGSCLVYATCALNHNENDGVVMRLKKKFPDAHFLSPEEIGEVFERNLEKLLPAVKLPDCGFSLQDVFSCAERTELGFHILPDTAFGCGPLYFSCIRKA